MRPYGSLLFLISHCCETITTEAAPFSLRSFNYLNLYNSFIPKVAFAKHLAESDTSVNRDELSSKR